MRATQIVSNCIFNLLKECNYNKIFIYGSRFLELENLVLKMTSSPMIGGDVDFLNVALGKYISGNEEKINLGDEICNNFNLINEVSLTELEKLSYLFLYHEFYARKRSKHSDRLFNNVCSNSYDLIENIKSQIKDIKFKIYDFQQSNLEKFIVQVESDDLVLIDNRGKHCVNKKIIDYLLNSNIKFLIVSKNEIVKIQQYKIVESEILYLYSNVKSKKYLLENNYKNEEVMVDVFDENNINDIEIKQLSFHQFDYLRQQYLSKKITQLGKPKLCIGLFSKNKLLGVIGLSTDIKNSPPSTLEKPCIYLLSDFTVTKSVKFISKLVLYCALSKEIKQLAERLTKREVKSMFTNVFTSHPTSIKYRGLFLLFDRKTLKDGSYNLTYASPAGRWTLEEGVNLWKQKLLK